MPATCVDASSHDPVVCSGSVNASATLFSTLLDPEDDWMEVEIDSDGEFFAASAAPSVCPQEIHYMPAEAMSVHAATSPPPDTLLSGEELITEEDEPASSRSPCFNANLCSKHTFFACCNG